MNLPAHFMCRPTGDGLEFFIDAHANGKVGVSLKLAICLAASYFAIVICVDTDVFEMINIFNFVYPDV